MRLLQKILQFKKEYKNSPLLKMWFGLLFIVLFATEIKSQGICVPSRLEVISLFGQVMTEQNVPLINSTIEIRTASPEQKVVVSVKADENGRFTFTNIKPGKYVIYAGHPYYNHFAFPITLHKLSRVNKVTVPKNGLIIVVGLKNEVCDGSYAKYGNKTTIN